MFLHFYGYFSNFEKQITVAQNNTVNFIIESMGPRTSIKQT